MSWADIMKFVTAYFNRLQICSDFSGLTLPTSLTNANEDFSTLLLLTADDITALPSVVVSSDSHYTFYTDGSLINLGTNEVSMGWGWVQVVQDSGFLNSIATFKHGIIHDWPSSSRAEATAIYAALSAYPVSRFILIHKRLLMT
jgi:hypothetical protein